MHVWVMPKPQIHKEYGPRFPASPHISYTMDCPAVLIGRDATSRCYDQWVGQLLTWMPYNYSHVVHKILKLPDYKNGCITDITQ
jgi:hypothetical protein